MSKRTIAILLLIGLPLSFFAGLRFQKTMTKIDGIGEPLLTTIKFPNSQLKDTVYLVTKRWGYTGDHQVYALTKTEPSDNHWQPNQMMDLIWQGDNTIFYQQERDTIKIFSLQLPDKNKELETKQFIFIKQIDRGSFDKLLKQVKDGIKIID